ncbi:VanZ family protein [bacterium]|nr:VanZ family protein [bacterium]
MRIWYSVKGRLSIVWFYTIMTFMLSSMSKPPEQLPNMFEIPGFDLIMHFIEYGILAYLIMKYYEINEKSITFFVQALRTVLFCGIIGGLNEFWQLRTPGRDFSLMDGIVNILGALVVVFVYRFHQIHKFTENSK